VNAPPPPNQAPNAAFTQNCSDLTCTFNSEGSSDPEGGTIVRSWNFGDGSDRSNEVNPSHTYAAGGTYDVELTVTDGGGLSDSETHRITVTAPPPNQAPTAAFSRSCNDLACSFNSEASSDPENGSIRRSWNFGDGSEASDDVNPSHTYASEGTYTVVLTVTDEGGLSDTESETFSVTAPNQDPTAVFTESCTGLTCSFNSAGTVDPNGDPLTYEWDFDDRGAKSTDPNPSYTFTRAGSHKVRLRVRDNRGGQDEAERSVDVQARNTAPTAVIGSISCTGMDCRFEDASIDPDGSATIREWSWVFGDGEASERIQNPSHVYATAGNYTVTLTVKDSEGATSNTAQQGLTVAPLPEELRRSKGIARANPS
jgi:PKD repeat protein